MHLVIYCIGKSKNIYFFLHIVLLHDFPLKAIRCNTKELAWHPVIQCWSRADCLCVELDFACDSMLKQIGMTSRDSMLKPRRLPVRAWNLTLHVTQCWNSVIQCWSRADCLCVRETWLCMWHNVETAWFNFEAWPARILTLRYSMLKPRRLTIMHGAWLNGIRDLSHSFLDI